MIRTFILSAVILVPHAVSAETIAIRGATVIDTAGTKDLADATVLIEKGRIASVGRNLRVPKGARVIDGRGKFLIPGLIDGHVHFFQSGGIHTRPDALDLRSDVPYEKEIAALKARLPDTFRRYAAAGVTGAVDMGGPMWNFEVRDNARRQAGAPHVWAAGPLLSPHQPPELVTQDPPILKTSTPEEASQQARAQVALRPDFLKFWYIVGKDGPAAARPRLAAMIAEGRKAGVRSAVHATELETARAAVAEGADVLVHSVDDKEVDDAFVAAVRSRGTFYIPTLIVMGRYGETFAGRNPLSPGERAGGHPDITAPFERLDKVKLPSWGKQAAQQLSATLPVMQRNLMKMYNAGVPIVMGTDAGNIGTIHANSLPVEMKGWPMPACPRAPCSPAPPSFRPECSADRRTSALSSAARSPTSSSCGRTREATSPPSPPSTR